MVLAGAGASTGGAFCGAAIRDLRYPVIAWLTFTTAGAATKAAGTGTSRTWSFRWGTISRGSPVSGPAASTFYWGFSPPAVGKVVRRCSGHATRAADAVSSTRASTAFRPTAPGAAPFLAADAVSVPGSSTLLP